MKMMKDENCIAYLERKINAVIDLLEIAKKYCEAGNDSVDSIVPLVSLIEVMLTSQRDIAEKFDNMLV